MYFSKLLAIIITLSSVSVFAQWQAISTIEFNKTIESLNKVVFKEKSFGFTAKQSFFKNATSNDTINKMDYSYAYYEPLELVNIKEFGTLLVQNKQIQIRVDSIEQVVIISEANPALNKNTLKDVFEKDASIKYQVYKKFQASQTIYKMKFDTLNKYQTIQIYVNKNNVINKASFLAGRPIQDIDSEEILAIYPRMDIDYTGFYYGEEIKSSSLIQPEAFFSDEGYTQLRAKYASYEILDSRKKEQK